MKVEETFLDEVRNFASSLSLNDGFEYSKEHLAYVFDGNSDDFDCPSCNERVSYGECLCGNMWNVYRIIENDKVKTVARKINKDEMLMKVARFEEEELELF